MEQASPAKPYPPRSVVEAVSDFWHQHLSPVLLFSVLAVVIGTWLLFLLRRPQSLSTNLVFVIGALFPALLGIISGSLAAIQFMDLLGSGGGGPEPSLGPSRPAKLAREVGQMILYPLYGSTLTLVLLVCGIGLLILRCRKND